MELVRYHHGGCSVEPIRQQCIVTLVHSFYLTSTVTAIVVLSLEIHAAGGNDRQTVFSPGESDRRNQGYTAESAGICNGIGKVYPNPNLLCRSMRWPSSQR